MKFLVDENCDFAIVRALRAAGFDVEAVGEVSRGAPDSEVVNRAVQEGRILVTEDRDFGQLVWAGGKGAAGVIYLRYSHSARQTVAGRVVELVRREGDRLNQRFVVVEPGRIRMRMWPKPD